MAIEVGNFDEAQSLLDEGLRIRRELGDVAAIPRSLWQLIRLDEARGDLALAREHCEEALAIASDTNDRQAIGLWLTALGDIVLNQDDFASAAALYEQSLAIRRQLGDEGAAAIVLAKLAQVRTMTATWPVRAGSSKRAFRHCVRWVTDRDSPRRSRTSRR